MPAVTEKIPFPRLRHSLLACLLKAGLLAVPFSLPTSAQALTASEQTNLRALNDRGVYWYERMRFDLAAEAFNRMLLLDPDNASALRWQGLVNLARGDVQAAGVWLGKLRKLHGQSAYTLELQQAIALESDKRQAFAELRHLAASEQVPGNLPQRLMNLFPQNPVGEAALRVYPLMKNTPEGAALARAEVSKLAARFPEDRRYRVLLGELNGERNSTPVTAQVAEPPAPANRSASRPASTPAPAARASTPKIRPTSPPASPPAATDPAPAPEPVIVQAPAEPDSAAEVSVFEQGQQLASQAQQALDQRKPAEAIELLRQAIRLNPAYPWFRYDLAVLLDGQGKPEDRRQARQLMEEGMRLENGRDMRFATALLAARQNRSQDALTLIQAIPRTDWTEGMTALEKRVLYGRYLDTLRLAEQTGDRNRLAAAIASTPTWRAEPEVQALQQDLERSRQIRLRLSYENSVIDGDTGVSRIESTEVPLQVDLPLDFARTLFLRADSLSAKAGRVEPATAANFAKLGSTLPNDPAISSPQLDQNYRGHVVGIGLQTQNYRLDVGTTTGDFPVNDWVGGLQWRTDLGQGSLRLEVARRMVTGSVLSTTGAIDPLTGERWGGARRNGVSAVYYQAFSPTLDFVGIARANRITGKNIPDNREFNLQGIVGKTVFQRPGQEVEVGASLFLWSFDRNLRFYTFGQGGYYSPQAFGSLTFPITWTGQKQGWSWQVQARIGASESREDSTALYPRNPELAAAALAQGNPVVQEGGPGGGVSTGLRMALERKLMGNLVLGGYVDIDRSEGYNPDRFQLYLKYSFGDFFELGIPPEGVPAYSRF